MSSVCSRGEGQVDLLRQNQRLVGIVRDIDGRKPTGPERGDEAPLAVRRWDDAHWIRAHRQPLNDLQLSGLHLSADNFMSRFIRREQQIPCGRIASPRAFCRRISLTDLFFRRIHDRNRAALPVATTASLPSPENCKATGRRSISAAHERISGLGGVQKS